MTVEELMELKRKADAIAEIEKTVAKETDTYKLALDNIRQALKYIETTMRRVGVEYAEIKKFQWDKSAIFHLDNDIFSVQMLGEQDNKVIINDSDFISAVTFITYISKDNPIRQIRDEFSQLAEHWAKYKQQFLDYIEESLKGSIKNSQRIITERTERYVTAKEFQV